jgi:plastocyanin
VVFAAVLVAAGLPAVPVAAWDGTAPVQVAIADFYFQPQSFSIAPGTTVTWVNNGPSQHTTTADGGAWSSGPLNPGGTYAVLFNTAGTYTYHCAIHPQMTATIVVGAQPTSAQPSVPPPFGYTPYGYAPQPAYPPYTPYGYAPGYPSYATQPAYPPYTPYGYPPAYTPYPPYTPYAAPPPPPAPHPDHNEHHHHHG